MKCDSTELSELCPDTRLTREDTTFASLLFEMSTQVSAALCQNTPTVVLGLQKRYFLRYYAKYMSKLVPTTNVKYFTGAVFLLDSLQKQDWKQIIC